MASFESDFRLPARWNDASRVPSSLGSIPDIIYDMPGGALLWHDRGEVVLDALSLSSAPPPLIAFRSCSNSEAATWRATVKRTSGRSQNAFGKERDTLIRTEYGFRAHGQGSAL